ncbi:hypothetical protein [Acinetobacter bereziniae]|uniref:hypothetical protein n=1 Tax=Acinetobacter bereziniae TaxID=106648 RepID=UPI001250B18B|nr:hypothetical protein [Acinetobacter bereziniae]MCU4320602.1 hypothetical protein [Acinetobacter bereziniae]
MSIPTVTDGLEDGIIAKIAYPVGHDDKDTEIEIKEGADCYIFFEQGDPSSPVMWAYSSHGVGAIVDYRRIRQENIELLARANININAQDTIYLSAKKLIIDADIEINGNQKLNGNNTTTGTSDLQGETSIENKPYRDHGHLKVKSGDDTSGGVAP